jgi:site-specific DNA-methyltransferase (adenine-specific)
MLINLLRGDCLEKMKEISESSIDMILADPPYGTTACKWDSIIPLEPMWKQLKRIIKPNGAIAMTASQPFTTIVISSNIKMFKYCWYWQKNKKTGFLNAKRQPLRHIEEVIIFYSKQCTYNPQKTTGHRPVNSFTKHRGDGDTVGETKLGFSGGGQTDRYPANTLRIPVVNNDNSGGDKLHSTQKPVALMEYLIKTYTKEEETVLDFAMGSGTTGVACKNLNRNFIGIELDEKYFKIAEKRIGGS